MDQDKRCRFKWKSKRESAGSDEDVHISSFSDMEASWILIPKLSPLSSPRHPPSTTLSSMQSFIPNIGEGSQSPHHWLQVRKLDAWIAERLLLFTGTRSQRRFPVCTSCPRRAGGSAYQCPKVNPPSGTPCWADAPQAAKPCSTEWCPCRQQTRSAWEASVLMLTLVRDAHCCYQRLFWEGFCLLRGCGTSWIPPEGRWWGWCLLILLTCSTSGATWSWTQSANLCSPATHWELWRTKNATHWQRYQRRREAKAGHRCGEHLDSILLSTALSVFFFSNINSVLD